jgi:L-seryl-tRNA(Ser) seleniumtransferase
MRRLRSLMDDARTTIRAAAQQRLPEVTVAGRRLVERLLAEPGDAHRPAINATGVLTPDWGMPPLPPLAAERMFRLAACQSASDDQIRRHQQPATGECEPPTPLESRVGGALAAWVDAEHGLVLHNLAAATQSALACLAANKPVVVARSQLGWIDRRASIRLTDVAAAAGVSLREIGGVEGATTADYRQAVSSGAGLVLYCQPTGYQIEGVVEQAMLEEVVLVARRAAVPLVVALPAACWPEVPSGDAAGVPLVSRALAVGADVVIASGDRYLGGPPVGIVLGRQHLIALIAASPLAKISAADRLTLTALDATLELARQRANGEQGIPLWQMLAASPDALRSRAERLAPQLAACPGVARAEVVEGFAYRGPGKLPSDRLPDWQVQIVPDDGSPERLADELRRGTPSIWTGEEAGRVVISLRSVLAADDERLVSAFGRLAAT